MFSKPYQKPRRMEEESSNYPERRLGHIVIHWKIHNYLLARMRPHYNIISPKFHVRGPQTTTWQLILCPNSQANEISLILQLQRLDNKPAVALVTWRVIIKDIEGSCVCVNGNQNFFKQCSANGNRVPDAAHMAFDNLSPFKLDTMHLQCQLLVSHKEANRSFKICSDIGLKSLSRDLLALYKSGKYSDVEIRIDDKSIPAHKAILQARSPYFKSLIEDNLDAKSFYFSPLNFKAVDKVLSYMYSGKLEFVLGKPSISIYDCARCFRIKELKQYYAFDELFLDSSTDVEKMEVLWRIKNFGTLNKPVESEHISLVSNTTLRFRLHPKGLDGIWFASAEILPEGKHRRVQLEVGILDVYSRIRNKKRVSWSDTNIKEPEFELVNRNILANPDVFRGILNIIIKLRICDSEVTWKTSRTDQMYTFASPNEKEHSYKRISNDIGSLFFNGLLKDMALNTGILQYRVHKCILAARSRGFSEKIREMIRSDATSSKLHMRCETFYTLMNYLYSGILKDYKPSDVKEIYSIAEELTMPTLKIICSRILGSKLTLKTVSDVLIFAESKQDRELKLSALKFVCLNQSAICKEQNWQQLGESHPLLYSEAQEYCQEVPLY